MALPSVEITITLDDTSTEPDRRKNGSKEQTATAATVDEQADVEPSQTSEGTRSQAPVKEQPSPRPRRLPFLNEIRSRSPVNTGEWCYCLFVIFVATMYSTQHAIGGCIADRKVLKLSSNFI